jgi:hypothetical protein
MFQRRKLHQAAAKKFRLGADEIRPLRTGLGGCYATDRITVDGLPVGYLYREEPDHAADSGWRFFAGDESDEYANDPTNLAIYDVNTICNYDPDVIALLDAPAGAAFERHEVGGPFVAIDNA